jgi:uridine kinase
MAVPAPRTSAESVLAELDARPPLLGVTRLVCVDGPAGSGKTTLAGSVHALVHASGRRVATVHMDDLYEGWTGLTAKIEPRLLDQILLPMATGAKARWQRYDWSAARFADWSDLPSPLDVLVLEGCGSGALAYAQYTALLVWVEAPRAVRLDRGLERDGGQVLNDWLAWMELEADYFAANRTRDRADLRISTG